MDRQVIMVENMNNGVCFLDMDGKSHLTSHEMINDSMC